MVNNLNQSFKFIMDLTNRTAIESLSSYLKLTKANLNVQPSKMLCISEKDCFSLGRK